VSVIIWFDDLAAFCCACTTTNATIAVQHVAIIFFHILNPLFQVRLTEARTRSYTTAIGSRFAFETDAYEPYRQANFLIRLHKK